MVENDNLHILTREELKKYSASDFKEGDVVICNKYYIHVKYGNYRRASLQTIVNSRDDIRDLPMRKHPQYIRDFIEREKTVVSA